MVLRAFLPLRIDTRSLVLDRGARRPQPAILLSGQRRDAAAAVIGHQHCLARAVNDQVARAVAFRGLLVQEREVSAGRVDGNGADRAAFAAGTRFICRVEETAIRMNGQETRAYRLTRQPE